MKVKVSQSCPTLCHSMDYTYSPWNSPGRNTGMGRLSLSPGDLPKPGIEPRSPTLWMDSLPAGPQRKPKNTRLGSLSLLKQMLLIQESNRGLLHCRQILYQLNYQESWWQGKMVYPLWKPVWPFLKKLYGPAVPQELRYLYPCFHSNIIHNS